MKEANGNVVLLNTPSPALRASSPAGGEGNNGCFLPPWRGKVGGARMRGNSTGFTLIELLVVVLIIGILAAVAVPQYQKTVDRARVTELLTLTKHVKEMQEVYYLAQGSYAANCEDLGIDVPDGYTLTESKQLKNTKKYFGIDCMINAGSHDRVRGTYRPDKENEGLSIENGLLFNPKDWAKGRIWCYADYDRLKPMCKSLCGTELTEDDGHSCFIR